jgi:sulfatase-modifying factor enzyme 1
LLATGEWTPLAAYAGGDERPRVVASRWTDGSTTFWAIVNRGDETFEGTLEGGDFAVVVPARGIAAVVDGAQVAAAPGDQSVSFPARTLRRIHAPSVAQSTVPAGFVEAVRPSAPVTAVFRRRETGSYGDAPFVDEWKPLPPRLHALEELTHEAVAARRFAIGRREVTNAQLGLEGAPEAPASRVTLAEARAFAASRAARLPTEDEWQLAAEAGLLERLDPLVWNWTESEHSDGRTRFVILKGGSAWRAEGSDWYVEGGPHDAAYSLKLLLAGDEIARSRWIGFRLAVDL